TSSPTRRATGWRTAGSRGSGPAATGCARWGNWKTAASSSRRTTRPNGRNTRRSRRKAVMKNRHRTQRNKDQARPRARRRSARVEWEEAGGISAFQHILGNRGVERLLQNGKRPDSRTVSGALLPALRRAFDVQAARLAAAPVIQR